MILAVRRKSLAIKHEPIFIDSDPYERTWRTAHKMANSTSPRDDIYFGTDSLCFMVDSLYLRPKWRILVAFYVAATDAKMVMG
jgi:hypothetical protein